MLQNEEAQAWAKVWECAFGFIKTSVVTSAVELEIPDIVEKRGAPISLSDLSSAADLPPDVLRRIMRFLAYHGVFKITGPDDDASSVYYAPTPLSRLLRRENMGPLVQLQLQGSPTGPLDGLSPEALRTGGSRLSSKYLYEDPNFGTRVFRDAMAAHARFTASLIIDNYSEGFEGVGSLVDVGGSHGTALRMLVKAFPWVRGVCYDLPEVVAKASPIDGIEFVGGSMFEGVPKADMVMLMFVLHNWSDEECIEILRKCKEAVPRKTGKVIILDAVIDKEDEYTGTCLALDMTMLAVTMKGKERTYKEWAYILKQAGFTKHVVRSIKTIESVIEAYP